MRNRLALMLVDGSNAYATAKALGFQIDYATLLKVYTEAECPIFKAFYFTAIAPGENPVRTLVDWLTYNGWSTITKPTSEWVQDDGRKKIKGNMDIEIATIALETAMTVRDLTDIVLFSGDGDFTFLVDTLQRRYGLRVTVVSTIATKPGMCADSLRRQCDEFIDMKELIEDIQRKKREAR